MPAEFHKPVRRPTEVFDALMGSVDHAESSRVAHSTAQALLSRVRANPDPEIVSRLLHFTREHGIDTVASLWAQAPARSLPGALWRVHLLQLMVHDDAQTASLLYERGRHELRSADAVIAGAETPAGPEEIAALADRILQGMFDGDFAIALQRAAAFCRVEASGATHVADDAELSEPERASAFTKRALRLSSIATDLSAAAALWNANELH